MKCPFCGKDNNGVCDTRNNESNVRRRRKCFSCGKKFTTYEVMDNDYNHLGYQIGYQIGYQDGFKEGRTRRDLSEALNE